MAGKGENNDDDDSDLINNILNFHLLKNKNEKTKELLTIFNNLNEDIITIQLDRDRSNKNCVMLLTNHINGAVQEKKHFDLIFERNKKTKTSVYALMPYDDNNDSYNPDNITTRYLKATFKDKVEKIIADIKSQNPDISSDASLAYHFPEIQEMKNDKRNWRYSLNFKGMLLYLLGESKIILSSPSSKKSKNRIKGVISNPLVTQEIVPFLKYWQYFFNEHYNFNVIDVLLKIAVELENQFYIDTKDDFYLLRRASERYFIELENYLYPILDSPLYYYDIKDVGHAKHDELLKTRKKYRQEVMIYWLNKFRAKDEEFINYLQRECDRETS